VDPQPWDRLNVFIPGSYNPSQHMSVHMVERRKFYTSFHDLSPREYMYIPEGSLQTGKPGSFSRTEIQHILIAIFVLTVAFSFTLSPVFSYNVIPPVYRFNLSLFLATLPISFIGLLTALFVHELSHKFMAQKYGLWSEFRMYPLGLLLSLLLGIFTGYVFAAPGAVMFRGETKPFEMGRIAAAGPTANIITAAVTFPFSVWFFDASFAGFSVGGVIVFVCFVNAFLATFNLIPLGPLDGRKVLRWNEIAWFLLFTCAVLLVIANFYRGVILPL
jgi:Zn-dependent protease